MCSLLRVKNVRHLHVLGIESTCDDAAVSVINFEHRRVLADRRSADHDSLHRLGGVLPYASARHHRAVISRLLEEALQDANLRASDVDAVAVSNRPGIILSLKVGVEHALSFARNFRRPLIPVHHLRSHTLVARLQHAQLEFPFAALIASGAHCLVCTVLGPNEFYVLVDTLRGSPGETLDKLARALMLKPHKGSFGAALEQWAKKCPSDQIGRYALPLCLHEGSSSYHMDFDPFKGRYMQLIRSRPGWMTDQDALATWCAGIQNSFTELICHHLEAALAFLASHSLDLAHRKLVISGGVAANAYFISYVRNTASIHGFEVIALPSELCTDNAVMVAWTGAEIYAAKLREQRSELPNQGEHIMATEEESIYWPELPLPDTLWIKYKAPIGPYHEQFLKNNIEAPNTFTYN